MTNPDYRAMCAELVDDLEMSDWPSKLKEAFRADIARARALLAQPVAEVPTDEDLEDLAEVMNVSGNPVPAMRRALELWGTLPPQPPAAGEVAELVKWLRFEADDDDRHDQTYWLDGAQLRRIAELLQRQHPQPEPQPPAAGEAVEAALIELRSTVIGLRQQRLFVAAQRVERAAYLLQHQHPQPVAVSERLPGPEDCTAEGRCWLHYTNVCNVTQWSLILRSAILDGPYTHWLPANALPTPRGHQ